MGSNDRETKFRCLEIDRTQPYELMFREDPNEIEARDIRRRVSQLGHCKVSKCETVVSTDFEKYFSLIIEN